MCVCVCVCVLSQNYSSNEITLLLGSIGNLNEVWFSQSEPIENR